MDTQIKLSFETSNIKGNKNPRIIDINIINSTNDNDCIIEFQEYEDIKLYLESEREDDYVKIECFDDEELKTLYNNQSIIVSVKEEEHMLVPGYYPIVIKVNNKIYNRLYKINPSSIDWEGLVKIREYLESIMKGLAYNLYKERLCGIQNEEIELNMYNIYDYLSKNEDHLISILDMIIKNPLEDIDKEYRISHINKKADYKSQNWLCRKGTLINQNIYQPDITYQKHSCLTKIIKENIWIKNILSEINIKMVDLEKEFTLLLQQKKRKIIDIENKLLILENNIKEIKNDYIISDKVKKEKKYRKNILESEKIKFNNNINHLNNIVRNINRLRARLTFYEHETWLSKISRKKEILVSDRLFRDHRYYYIYTVYKYLQQKNIMDKNVIKSNITFKKTSKLYEYYIVVLLIDILRELGFEWEEGWIADYKNNNIYFKDLESGSKFIFKYISYKLEIRYDYEIRNKITDDNDFMCINDINCRPDILICIYDENGDILNAMIIEVKCRKSGNIYSKKGDTRVMEQLKKYYSLACYNSKYQNKRRNLNRNIISKVVVTYPKQKFKVDFYDDVLNFEFIQISPSKEKNLTYGYSEMKKSVEEFLKESIEV